MGNVQHQQYGFAISSSFGNASEPKPGVRMSRLNTNESAARAQRQKRKPPLVVMVILASMQPKMWQELSSQWLQKQSLCSDHNFECVFYADRDEGVMEREVETKIKLIPPRKYLSDPSSMSMPRPCCAWSTHQTATNRTAPISSVSSGAGRLGPDRARSSSCGSPRFRDENPQWPLLAILSHARRSRLMKWTDGTGPSWLMMLKFNSKVNAPKLLSLLSAYDPANPLSMGDFVHASSTNGKPAYEAGTRSEMVISDPANEHASRGFELFACQGSGIVFSRAAVVKVKFSSCAQQSYQSAIGGSVDEGGTDVCAVPEMDVGACIARHHEVKLVQNASCGLCQITCSSKQWQAELAQSVGVLHKNTCFAQLSVPPQAAAGRCKLNSMQQQVARRLCVHAAINAAVTNGVREFCEQRGLGDVWKKVEAVYADYARANRQTARSRVAGATNRSAGNKLSSRLNQLATQLLKSGAMDHHRRITCAAPPLPSRVAGGGGSSADLTPTRRAFGRKSTPSPSLQPKVDVAAIIVEPRWDLDIEHTISHYLRMLPSEVPVYWYSDFLNENFTVTQIQSADLVEAYQTGRFRSCTMRTHEGARLALGKELYNEMRLEPSFWRSMPAPRVLFFERDSILCSGALPLSHFLDADYDYLGAPWDPRQAWCAKLRSPTSCCCNSGLSLVNTPRMGVVLQRMTAEPIADDNRWSKKYNDMYLLLKHEQNESAGLRLPNREQAQLFAVETYWDGHAVPFGLHKPWRANFFADASAPAPNIGNMSKLTLLGQMCPEIKLLCSSARASSTSDDPELGPPSKIFMKQFC